MREAIPRRTTNMTIDLVYLPPSGGGFHPEKDVFVQGHWRTSKLGNVHWVRDHWRSKPKRDGFRHHA